MSYGAGSPFFSYIESNELKKMISTSLMLNIFLNAPVRNVFVLNFAAKLGCKNHVDLFLNIMHHIVYKLIAYCVPPPLGK